MLIGCMVLAVGGYFWLEGRIHIETDNAFVEAPIHRIAARLSGSVTKVLIEDNQLVKKGDLLLILDDRDARAQVDKARAQLELARNECTSDRAQVEESKAELAKGRTQEEQAARNLQRAVVLFAKKVIPQEQLDRVRTEYQVAQASVRVAQEKLKKDQATVGQSMGQATTALVAQRQAELELAQLQLSYTRLYAPADGLITRKAVEVGNWIQPGQALMAVVSASEPWITANYKESQLAQVHPGMRVRFSVDTYPGIEFNGRVDSIMAGTGAAFSLLPPENATGNYVKVTQRIPVKITIDVADTDRFPLRVGMSVVPTILVKNSVLEYFAQPSSPLALTAQLIQGKDVFDSQK